MDVRIKRCKLLVKAAWSLGFMLNLGCLLSALGADASLASASSSAPPCSETITGTERDLKVMQVDTLCISAYNPRTDRPIYQRTHQDGLVRFYINQDRLILIVTDSDFSTLASDQSNKERQRHLSSRFPDDLLKIWFDDAQHWLRWLEGFDDPWIL